MLISSWYSPILASRRCIAKRSGAADAAGGCLRARVPTRQNARAPKTVAGSRGGSSALRIISEFCSDCC